MSAAPAQRPSYLLVESQAGPTAELFVGDGLALASGGAEVSMYLVADGVSLAVDTEQSPLVALVAAGGRVRVDEFTLAQRAIPRGSLLAGAGVAGMDEVAATLDDPALRVVWH